MISTYLASAGVVAGTTLVGTLVIEVNETAGTVVDTRSNAELRLKKACLLQLGEMATITAKDPGTRPAIGASGTMVLTGVRHTGGVTLAGSITYTCAAVTVKAVRSTIGDDGQPRVVIEVEILSADGQASGLSMAVV